MLDLGGSRGSSWTSHGDHSLSASALPLLFICVFHELVFGFEPWFVMCDELC